MNSLASELKGGGGAETPTSFRLLLPPGWRGFGIDAEAEAVLVGMMRERFRQAGRPDLDAQARTLVSKQFAALRRNRAAGIYLPVEADESAPLGMSIVAARHQAPPGLVVADTAHQRSKGKAVEVVLPDHTLYRWVEERDAPEGAEGVTGRSIHYLITAPNSDNRRAMLISTGLLHATGEDESDAVVLLETLSDGIVGTFLWT